MSCFLLHPCNKKGYFSVFFHSFLLWQQRPQMNFFHQKFSLENIYISIYMKNYLQIIRKPLQRTTTTNSYITCFNSWYTADSELFCNFATKYWELHVSWFHSQKSRPQEFEPTVFLASPPTPQYTVG